MPYKDADKQREWQLRRIQQRRADFFANKCCVRCGSTEKLQLDHCDAATKVTHKVFGLSKVKREAELAKCQLLCEPCHKQKSREAGDYTRGRELVEIGVVKEIRRRYAAGGITQESLAIEFGVSRKSVSDWCSGKRR